MSSSWGPRAYRLRQARVSDLDLLEIERFLLRRLIYIRCHKVDFNGFLKVIKLRLIR